MLDRAVSGYIPYIFEEDPELKEQFAGFTYYPNCLSFGEHTNFGAPAKFGGYEYSPKAINDRKGMTIAQKHNEALCVLPEMFSNEDYDITICDPPYAGYKEIADFSIYNGIDRVRGLHLSGALLPDNYDEMLALHQAYRKHSFLTYSVFASSPVALRWWIYDNGGYRGTRRFTDNSPSEELIHEYTPLQELPNISIAEDSHENHLFMMDNNLTHNPEPLQLPGYTMPIVIDNSAVQNKWLHQFDDKPIRMYEDYTGPDGFKSHYQVNAAAIHLIGDWLNWMRENDVYDNTKIILVADHGIQMGQFPYMIMNEHLDVQGFNPLLMVKDFDAKSFTTSDDFMTNTDVPSIAIEGALKEHHNPFTGKLISQDGKEDSQYVTTSAHYEIKWGDNKEFNTADGKWFKVHDNIFDKNNWEKVD